MPLNVAHQHACSACLGIRHCWDEGCGNMSGSYPICPLCAGALHTTLIFLTGSSQYRLSKKAVNMLYAGGSKCPGCGKYGKVPWNGRSWCMHCFRSSDGANGATSSAVVDKAMELRMALVNLLTPLGGGAAEGPSAPKKPKCQCNPCSGHTN